MFSGLGHSTGPILVADSTMDYIRQPIAEPLKESAVEKIDTTSKEYVQRAVAKEFGADSVMYKIARCEGRFVQIDKATGEALRGRQNRLDRGVFQINEYYHLSTSKKMGIDILTLEGNIKYARFLYDTQGTRPWNWSKACWGV